MKNKRILLIAVIIIALLSIVMGALVACNDNDDTSTKTVTVTLMDNEQTVTTDKAYLGDVLKDLKSKGLVEFEYENSQFGMFITSICGITPAINEFVGVYLSSDDPENAYLLAPPITKNDVTYYSAGKGVDTLPIIDGMKYYLVITEQIF